MKILSVIWRIHPLFRAILKFVSTKPLSSSHFHKITKACDEALLLITSNSYVVVVN